MKKITITVSGPLNSGRSRIIYILKEILKDYEFEVEFNPSPDFLSESAFNQTMRTGLDEAIKGISKDTKISIEEIQEKREE